LTSAAGLKALGAELAGIERPAQLIQCGGVLLAHALARGLQQDQMPRAAELCRDAHERLTLGRREAVRAQHHRLP